MAKRVKEKQEIGKSLLWSLREGVGEAGKEGLAWTSWNNFTGLWGMKAVCNYSLPDLGMIRAGK